MRKYIIIILLAVLHGCLMVAWWAVPVLVALLSAGSSYFNRPEEPEQRKRGEYKGPSPESLAALEALQTYMRGGGLGGGPTADTGGMGGVLQSVRGRMFPSGGTSATPGSPTGAATGNIQELIKRMFGGMR